VSNSENQFEDIERMQTNFARKRK